MGVITNQRSKRSGFMKNQLWALICTVNTDMKRLYQHSISREDLLRCQVICLWKNTGMKCLYQHSISREDVL